MSRNDLVVEIRDAFANLNPGEFGRLKVLPNEFPAYAYVADDSWGVAIDVDSNSDISERFSGARLYTATATIGQSVRRQLRLECSRLGLRREFAVVCSQFLEPGHAGEERARLLSSPLTWWKQWRELLGNAIRERKAFAVLGELLAFERLSVAGASPAWLGAKGKSHDIETSAGAYEVKSTLSKYSSTFHVTGQFQLRAPNQLPLFLVYQRFEPSSSGDSIDGVVRRLHEAGQYTEEIELDLARSGFEPGCSDRKTTFRLIQSTRYPVDDEFPRVTSESFVGGVVPRGVVRFEYEVDLSGLAGVPFE